MELSKREKIEIFIHGRTFPKTDSTQIIIYINEVDEWVECGRTEAISENINPNFKKTVVIDFKFEEQQHLKFVVCEIDTKKNLETIIGENEIKICEILGNRNQTKVVSIANKKGTKTGNLILRCDKYSKSLEGFAFKMKIENVRNMRNKFKFWVKSSPFIRIYKLIELLFKFI